MLRKEVDEMSIIKNQVKELARDVEMLKVQIKLNNGTKIFSKASGAVYSSNNSANIFGRMVGEGGTKNNVNESIYNKQLFGQIAKVFTTAIATPSSNRRSFDKR